MTRYAFGIAGGERRGGGDAAGGGAGADVSSRGGAAPLGSVIKLAQGGHPG